MSRYPPTGYIAFILKKVKFYGGRGSDNQNTQKK